MDPIHASGISRLWITNKNFYLMDSYIFNWVLKVDHAVKYCILGTVH